jgi:hypothetical protein
MSGLEAMMKMLILILVTMMSGDIFGLSTEEIHGLPDFKNKIVDMPTIGRLRIKNEYVDEPMTNPRRVSVELQCNGFPEWRLWIAFKIYALEDFRYDAQKKTFWMKYIEGRAVNGVPYFDIVQNPSFPTADLCRTQK